MKKIWKAIPKLPLTALGFYFIAFILWNSNLIPPPSEIVTILKSLYNNYGLAGLFIATMLEGIVYLGLYFPGSFIIALAVFFSDGKFTSLATISLVVAFTLTITAIINYWLGRHISFKENEEIIKHKKVTKGLFASMLHPNLLAFYFFKEGLERGNLWKAFFIPIIMFPYGLLFAYFLYAFSTAAKQRLESPLFLFSLIMIWLVVAFIFEHKRKIKKEIIDLV